MAGSESDETSATLLGRVGKDPSDHVAWEAFVACYGPKIRGWCRQRGLQPADAEDVTQDVLLRLSRALKTFTYDPSRTFRGWLRSVTQHALSDFATERRRRPGMGSGDARVLEVLGTVQARDELLARLEEQFDREVVAQACATVRAGRAANLGGVPADHERGPFRGRSGGATGSERHGGLQGQEPGHRVPS